MIIYIDRMRKNATSVGEMQWPFLQSCLQTRRKLLFLGESGSGKTELSVNFALYYAGGQSKPVHFFDLDQTKPLFRARNQGAVLLQAGVELHHSEITLDIPAPPGGLNEKLADQGCVCILDVGGNLNGARLAGCFAEHFLSADSLTFYLINIYRAWAHTAELIGETMSQVLAAGGQSEPFIIANPNFGQSTTSRDIVHGLKETEEMLSSLGLRSGALAVREDLLSPELAALHERILPVRQYFVH